jgi:hypothetical protein
MVQSYAGDLAGDKNSLHVTADKVLHVKWSARNRIQKKSDEGKIALSHGSHIHIKVTKSCPILKAADYKKVAPMLKHRR